MFLASYLANTEGDQSPRRGDIRCCSHVDRNSNDVSKHESVWVFWKRWIPICRIRTFFLFVFYFWKCLPESVWRERNGQNSTWAIDCVWSFSKRESLCHRREENSSRYLSIQPSVVFAQDVQSGREGAQRPIKHVLCGYSDFPGWRR